jgi:hypothetical protein
MFENHVESEGINFQTGFREDQKLEGWESEIEKHLTEHIEYMQDRYEQPLISSFEHEEDNWFDSLPELTSKEDHATREDLEEYVNVIHDIFEDVFEFGVADEDYGKVQEMHIYDESLGYKLKETVKTDEFIYSATKGAVASGVSSIINFGAGIYAFDKVYSSTNNYELASETMDQLMSFWPVSATVPVALGVSYGLWKSWDSIEDNFSGIYHPQGAGLGPDFLGEADERRIGIDSRTAHPITVFGTAISENMHFFQDLTDSSSFDEFLLNEGMDGVSNLLVLDKEPEVPKLSKEELREEKDFYELGMFTSAYASLKNKGADSVDPMTFTSAGFDPEMSTRMARDVERRFEEDSSPEHYYSGNIGGSLLWLALEENGEEILGDVIRGDFSGITEIERAEELDFLQEHIENSFLEIMRNKDNSHR